MAGGVAKLSKTGDYTQNPALTLSTPSNFVNCCGCESYTHARSRMNTSDFTYVYEWGAVEFIPNPYNPVNE